MSYEAIALPGAYTVRLGSIRIGMLQSFREQTNCKIAAVRAIGENKASHLIPGALTYKVKLNRLLLDTGTVDNPFLLHDLHAFQLSLIGCGRTVVYGGFCRDIRCITSAAVTRSHPRSRVRRRRS